MATSLGVISGSSLKMDRWLGNRVLQKKTYRQNQTNHSGTQIKQSVTVCLEFEYFIFIFSIISNCSLKSPLTGTIVFNAETFI